MRAMRILIGFVACAILPAATDSQRGQVADRIVARVGKSAITLTEVLESAHLRRISDPRSETMGLRALCQDQLDALIDEELLFQASEKFGVEAPEDEVVRRLVAITSGLTSKYGSEDALKKALEAQGLSLGKLLHELRLREERTIKISRSLQSRFIITNADVEEFARKRREQDEPTVAYQLCQILIECSADASAKETESALGRALQARSQVQRGMPFAEAAKRFSDQQSSRDNGGGLGILFEGEMAQTFESAAKKLEVGGVSYPIRSEIGFHILYLEAKQAAREILFSMRLEEERRAWIRELRRTETVELAPDCLKAIVEALTSGDAGLAVAPDVP